MWNRHTTRAAGRHVLGLVALAIGFGAPLVLGQVPSEAKGESPDKLSLRISLQKDTYEAGSAIPLRVEFQNLGEQEVLIGFLLDDESGVPSFIRFHVSDPSGTEVPAGYSVHLSPFGQDWGHGWWVPLRPGYFYGRDVYLTRSAYPFLSKVGEYRIFVQYEHLVPQNESTDDKRLQDARHHSRVFVGKLQSNTIKIKIIPSPAQ